MLRDRGNKKWRVFLMPENIKMLKELRLDDLKTPRPLLDETKIEEMERLLSESLKTQMLLEITWKNGFFTARVGLVKKIDPLKKKIQIQDQQESISISHPLQTSLLSRRLHHLFAKRKKDPWFVTYSIETYFSR
ncbi:YolD-like family protein [Bacillus sp. EB600]|uniref:YolD-like family protein n=1 Tax=Bacillus sp. EB600 TaxID=2806345 RepID=UPI00210B37C9|nr:YolD-like family protein [Bacillus sp. EB600]MCQ6281718.1 YolD-like family protein [Bacillus sp. EB600]